MRAIPSATDPRPVSDSVVDWPPPMERPGIDYPPDWLGDEAGTLIVIDPTRGQLSTRVWIVAIDAGAWLLGFVAMFLTGLVTTASGALVLFALSI
jgi:hypothetical protein